MLKKEEMLNEVLSHSRFVVMDLETTGFTPKKGAEILEIGARRYNADGHRVTATFHSFVKPKNVKKIPKKIVELTNIHDEDVKNAPYIEIVLKKLYEFIGGDVIVFHNAAFDWSRFLADGFEKIGKQVSNPVVCTLMLSKWLLPLNGYQGESYKLGDLSSYFGCKMVGAHRADVDALYTAALLGRLRELGAKTPCQSVIPNENGNKRREEDDFSSTRIQRISPWKKGNEERLYINTSTAQIYYDYVRNIWSVQRLKTGRSLDMNKWEPYLQRELNVSNLMEWLEDRRPS